MLSPVPPVDLVGANRTVLSEGDGPKQLTKIWRNEFTGDLQELLERFQDTEEAKLGLTPAHIEAVRFTTVPKGLAAAAMTARSTVFCGRCWTPMYVACRTTSPTPKWGRSPLVLPGPSPCLGGKREPGRPHYDRIQGHRLLIEYDNTTRDGNHVHAVWRDPVADFGADALRAHRRHAH